CERRYLTHHRRRPVLRVILPQVTRSMDGHSTSTEWTPDRRAPGTRAAGVRPLVVVAFIRCSVQRMSPRCVAGPRKAFQLGDPALQFPAKRLDVRRGIAAGAKRVTNLAGRKPRQEAARPNRILYWNVVTEPQEVHSSCKFGEIKEVFWRRGGGNIKVDETARRIPNQL